MQSLAVSGYSKQNVIAALHAPIRHISFRYGLLDENNNYIQDIETVQGGTIENNTLASIKRTARFVIDEDSSIDWLSHRIRPWFRLKMPDGGYAEWPQGVFLPQTPQRRIRPSGITVREVEAYDQMVVLVDDKVDGRYVVSAGTNYIDEVSSLLTGSGITSQNLSATDKVLPADRDWAPGTSKLEIIQDLLSAINYRSLFFDPSGAAVAKAYQPPGDRAIGYTYVTDDKSLVAPEAVVDFDLFEVPNKWVLTVSEPEIEPALISTYTNTNINSPTSTVNRGRTIVHYDQVEAADQSSLDAKVERLAFEASQVYEAVEFETALMPHHEDNDVIELDYPAVGPKARYTEHKWEMELRAGARMAHRIRRVVSV